MLTMTPSDAGRSRRAVNVESIRGIYQRTGQRWERQAPAGKAGCWMRQDLLPAAFTITEDGALQPLGEDGQPDQRYPASIALAPVHDSVARGHLSHYVRGEGHLSMGSLYVHAAMPDERWLELVTMGTDIDDPNASERRILRLVSNGDENLAMRCSQTLRRHLLRHTPSTLFPVAPWLR